MRGAGRPIKIAFSSFFFIRSNIKLVTVNTEVIIYEELLKYVSG